MPLSLAQGSRGRGPVAVLDRSQRGSVAVVLLADLAVVGGGADGGALLSLHGGAGDLRDLVTDLPGDVTTLLSLHLVAHLLGFLLANLTGNLITRLAGHLLTLLLSLLSRHVSEEK